MQLFRYAQVFNANAVIAAPWNLAFAPEVYVQGESGTAGTSTHGTRSGPGSGAGAFGGEPFWAGLAPGQTVTVTVPQGSTGNPTTVAAAGLTTVQANAGLAPVTTTGGLGGAAGANTIARAGGNGANSQSGSSVSGGGGGGSAGSTGAGGSTTTSAAGAAGTGAAGPPSLAGAPGQAGGGALVPGVNGVAPGGGASGGGSGGTINHAGGTGAAGQAIIIWTVWVQQATFRGAPSAARGRSASSAGAPVITAATTPATFRPPSSSTRPRTSAARGRSASSPGAAVIAAAPTPATFRPPSSSTRPRTSAARGRQASSPGAAVVATPALFRIPARPAPRGAPGARRGRAPSGLSSRGAVVVTRPSPFRPPVRPPRPSPAARRGRGRTGLASSGAVPPAPPTPKTLLISLASAAGVDDYGTSYPQGIFASAGVIQGPQFVGDDFIINSDGYFIYSGTPGAGNLIASSTSAAGADVFGNDYQEGFSVYGTGTSFAQLLDGFVNFQATTSQAGPGYIGNGGAPGLVEISSGQSTGSDTPALIDLLSRVASGAGQEQIIITALETIFNGDITATASNIDIPSGSINLNMAVPTNFPTAGKTLAQTQAAFDALVTSMINRLLIN